MLALEGQFDLVGWGTLLSGVAAVLVGFVTVVSVRNRRDVKAINAAVNNSHEDEDDPRHIRDIAKDIDQAIFKLTLESEERHAANEGRLANLERRSARSERRLRSIETHVAATDEVAAQLAERERRLDLRPPRLDPGDDDQ